MRSRVLLVVALTFLSASPVWAASPTVRDGGTVSVRLDLKTTHECKFVIGGVETPPTKLPAGAVVIPAACLLKRGQSVTLANFRRVE